MRHAGGDGGPSRADVCRYACAGELSCHDHLCHNTHDPGSDSYGDVYQHNFPNNDDLRNHDRNIDNVQPDNDGHRDYYHDIDKLQPNYNCDYNGNLDNIQSDDNRDHDRDSYY